jgi:DNA-nicking Smr family endonuclease
MSEDPTKKAQDIKLFREMMRDASPMEQDKIKPWHKRLPPHPLCHNQPEQNELPLDGLSETEIETGDELSFMRPGLQKRVFQDLRRGRLEIELELDLHGLTARHAQSALEQFLRDCHRREIRSARIIHGKGYGSEGRQPVLKHKVNLWLRQRQDVLAFCSATSRDGGTGAVYILLRSIRKNRY